MGKWLQEPQQRAAAGLRVLLHPAHAPGSYGNYTSLLTKALAVTYDRARHPNPLSTRGFLSPPGGISPPQSWHVGLTLGETHQVLNPDQEKERISWQQEDEDGKSEEAWPGSL